MTRSVRPLLIGLFAAIALLVLAGSSQAQYRYRGGIVRRQTFPNNRMPGWDWWRIYPWSPYNYGRNPYNPIIYPYNPYPYYPPYSPYYSYGGMPYESSAPAQQAPEYGAADSKQQVLVPHPSGAVTTPPADAAVIRLYIPDRFGTVSFDGVKTSSIGTTRYYVTPSLPSNKSLSYVVQASFQRDGQPVTEERAVLVNPGQTSVVDFNKPESK
jgi:uncharacterized protein (TIGR03000 family)